MNIPWDIFRHEIVPNLPVEDILKLCQTHKDLCEDKKLWYYLLKRDFDKVYIGDNPRDRYKYIWKLHDISDILCDNIVNQNIYLAFVNLGYKRVGNRLMLEDLNVANIIRQAANLDTRVYKGEGALMEKLKEMSNELIIRHGEQAFY